MPNSKLQKRRRNRILVQPSTVDGPTKASFSQEKKLTGLLVTKQLDHALEECTSQVKEIARDCRSKNRKFRDIEFDLEVDREMCLHGLGTKRFKPSDIQRATQIFDAPSFFIEGADSSDIVQGKLGDCWFLSALSTMSTAQGLVEKFCVARDEPVGVYGFIFFRHNAWVVVIIDDLLFTSIPKFEELRIDEKALYHHNKEVYNNSSRKSGEGLYFARSGTNGETWVPLIEKAYAKLHGNYASLIGGESGEAVEDLTGGVNTFISTKDILDPDAFWNDELLRATRDRLFGCSFGTLDNSRSGIDHVTVNGLLGGHAYSILRAVEYKGKRFVVIRNPWGKSEWNGPWSDGSKEWTAEWLPALQDLKHTFGDDGQFVMEYKDFLDNWHQIDRTLLFDSSWVMSSQWLQVTPRSPYSAWGYGDVSFTISLTEPSPAVIVLSTLDDRYFGPVASDWVWSFDFVLFRKGEKKPVAMSSRSAMISRSVNAEVNLTAGDYVVHVRLARKFPRCLRGEDSYDYDDYWDSPTYSRILTELAKSLSIASNYNKSATAKFLPIPLTKLAGQDIEQLEAKALAAAQNLEKEAEVIQGHPQGTDPPTLVKPDIVAEIKHDSNDIIDHPKDINGKCAEVDDGDNNDGNPVAATTDDKATEPSSGVDSNENELNEPVFIGLRVYTNKTSPAVIGGQLRHELAISFAGLTTNDV